MLAVTSSGCHSVPSEAHSSQSGLAWLCLSRGFHFRSVKIGVMEVGEELARRGHQVTVVSPHKYKKVPQGISDIVIPSEFDHYTTEVTLEFLTNPNTQLPISGVSFSVSMVLSNHYF